MEEEDYWNKSDSKAFSFDDERIVRLFYFIACFCINNFRYFTKKKCNFYCFKVSAPATSKRDVHIIHDDNISEMSFELPAFGNQIPINLLLTNEALQTGLCLLHIILLNMHFLIVFKFYFINSPRRTKPRRNANPQRHHTRRGTAHFAAQRPGSYLSTARPECDRQAGGQQTRCPGMFSVTAGQGIAAG